MNAAVTRVASPKLKRAAVSVVAALSVLAGPILGTAHLTAVKHVVCPQDGELVEVRQGAVAPGAESRFGSQSAIRATDSQRSEGEHAHDHCTFATHSLPRSTAKSTISVLTVVPDATHASVARHRYADVWSVDVYRIAPKSSPPSV